MQKPDFSMGSNQIKAPLPDSVIYNLMKNKYGLECLESVNFWVTKWGFPEGGSLSLKELQKIHDKLEKERENIMKWEIVWVPRYLKYEKNKKCLEIWMGEAEERERRAAMMEMAGGWDFSGAITGRMDNASVGAAPPAMQTLNKTTLPPTKLKPSLPLPVRPEAAVLQQEQPEQQEAPPPAQEMPGAQAGKAEAATDGSSHGDQPKTQVKSKPKAIAATTTNRSITKQRAGADHEEKCPLHTTDKAGLVIHAPVGLGGSMPVFRDWSDKDIEEAMESMPALVGNGVEFAKELGAICKVFHPTGYEIRRLMSKKLRPTDLRRIAAYLPPAEVCIVNPLSGVSSVGGKGSSLNPNAAYHLAVMKLCEAIETVFPLKPNLSLLNSIKQHLDESVYDFLLRMQEAFEKYSGMIKPAEVDIPESPWEQMLVNCILAGLLPDLLVQVKQQYVCISYGISLKDLRRHCLHAENVIRDRISKEKAQREKDLHQATINMYSVMLVGTSHVAQGRAGGKRRYNKLGRTREGDRCYNCGRFGHWRRDCLHPHRSICQTPRGHWGQAD